MTKFIAFDTEGLDINGDHQTILISNSEGDYLFNRNGLTFDQLFDFIIKPTDKTRVWFAFGYDVNMIFKNIDRKNQIDLFKKNECLINNYNIKYFSKKILKIHKNNSSHKEQYKINHYDVFGFFQKSFIESLKDWKIDIPHTLTKGKIGRIDFNSWCDPDIIEYNGLECKLLVQLMDKLDSKLIKNNIFLEHYHGAGAIASYLLGEIKADKYKCQNKDLEIVKRMAYFGGRIELFKRGFIKNIHHYDINSAYPWAMTKIPDLNAKWNYLSNTNENDLGEGLFGIVKAECIQSNSILGALPFRLNTGYVMYPQKSSGYYHICEVREAINKGYKIKLGESWILETPYTYPFHNYIEQLMAKRLEYKEKGDFAHIPLKLGANSFYGKLAQKPSMSKNKYREPKYRDLLMAGFITAHTRAQLLKYSHPSSIILMATDGLYSTISLGCNIGVGLGEWEYTHHDNGIFILAGIYTLNNENKWVNKIRGFRDLDITGLWHYIKQYPYEPIPFKDRRFVGIKYCLGLTNKAKEYKMCNFIDIPREIDWNNNRKRIFFPNGSSYSNNDLNNQSISAIYKDKLLNTLSDIVSVDNNLSECDIK